MRVQGERFAKSNAFTNRKLLWHGTNIAVVAAILRTGLRIMPHSGGSLQGKGIYFASENDKSAGYGLLLLSSGLLNYLTEFERECFVEVYILWTCTLA